MSIIRLFWSGQYCAEYSQLETPQPWSFSMVVVKLCVTLRLLVALGLHVHNAHFTIMTNHMSGCLNNGPFLGPYDITASVTLYPKTDLNFDNHPHGS